ncbi:MAG: hypothetical protein WBX14_05255, partial [Candidatus Udaeobacter sp.]
AAPGAQHPVIFVISGYNLAETASQSVSRAAKSRLLCQLATGAKRFSLADFSRIRVSGKIAQAWV